MPGTPLIAKGLRDDLLPVVTTDRKRPGARRVRLRWGLLAAAACLLFAGCGASTEAAEPDDGEPRLSQIIALGRANNPIPAGRWGAEIDGHNIELRPAQTLETVSYNYDDSDGPLSLLIFDSIPQDEQGGFFVIPFDGFVDGVQMRTPTSDDPLTSDEFIDGLSQAIPAENIAESSMGGQASVTWEIGPLEPDSAFACDSSDSSDLEEDDLCIRWGAAGERTVEFATGSVAWSFHYVESAGIAVIWSYTDNGAGDPFAELADSLLINP